MYVMYICIYVCMYIYIYIYKRPLLLFWPRAAALAGSPTLAAGTLRSSSEAPAPSSAQPRANPETQLRRMMSYGLGLCEHSILLPHLPFHRARLSSAGSREGPPWPCVIVCCAVIIICVV